MRGGGRHESIAYGNGMAPVLKNMTLNGFSIHWVKRDRSFKSNIILYP